jgi:transcriptional regulator with PAS, ATPase and Fis domain
MNLGIFNEDDRRDYLVGQSERMREVFDLVSCVSRSNTTAVLITGESGTGKEVVARAIHEQSAHACGPFQALNCAAIANNLFESELFGYEPHAFTDAKKQKCGLLELAEGGTLLLDEIGELPREMQAKLLRVLETRSFFRLGGTKEVRMKWEQWLKTHPQEAVSLDRLVERLEQCLVRWALETASYNRPRATVLLGLSKVEQLRYLIHKHGINTKNSPSDGDKHHDLLRTGSIHV